MGDDEVKINGRPLKDMKVAELKEACKQRNLPHSGNKATVLKRLKAAIQLEDLQKAARSSETAVQPNSNIGDNPAENDFVKQYLENQRKMLQKQHHRFSSASEAESEAEDHPRRAQINTSTEYSTENTSSTQESDEAKPDKETVTTKSSESFTTEHPTSGENNGEDLEHSGNRTEPNVQTDQTKTQQANMEVHKTENAVSNGEVEQDEVQIAMDKKEVALEEQEQVVDLSQNDGKKLLGEKQEDEPDAPAQETGDISNAKPVTDNVQLAKDDGENQPEVQKHHSPAPAEEDVKDSQKPKDEVQETVDDVGADVSMEVAPEKEEKKSQEKEPAEETEVVTEEVSVVKEDESSMGEQKQEEITEKVVEDTEANDVEGVPVITMETDVLIEEELDYDDAPDEDVEKSHHRHSKKKKKHHKESQKEKDLEAKSPEGKRRRIKRQSQDVQNAPKDMAITEESSKIKDKSEEESEQPAKESEPEPEAKSTRRKISLKKGPLRRSSASEQPREKKRRWGKASTSEEPQINISTDSLKNIIDVKEDDIREAVPDLPSSPKPHEKEEGEASDVEVVEEEEEEEEEGEIVEEVVVEEEIEEDDRMDEDESEAVAEKKSIHHDERNVVKASDVEEKRHAPIRRSISTKSNKKDDKPVKEVAKKTPRDVSPSIKPSTHTIHVSNLVRPFALSQLKQVLSEFGDIVENSFWINNIKSHCFVTYETEEIAKQTRNALHRLRWPVSSPKMLDVEFATKEDVAWYKEGRPAAAAKPVPEKKKREPEVEIKRRGEEIPPKRDERRDREQPKLTRVEDEPSRRGRERERAEPDRSNRHDNEKREKRRGADGEGGRSRSRNLREWDRNKLNQDEEVRRRREPTPPSQPEPRHRRRQQEAPPPPPPKLLDDLFRKTKATPCVYWLPLTEEQIQEREQEREKRREERAKIRKEKEEEEKQKAAQAREERNVRREESGSARKRDERRGDDRSRDRDTEVRSRREDPSSRGRREERKGEESRMRLSPGRRENKSNDRSTARSAASKKMEGKQIRKRKQSSSSSSSSDSSDSDSGDSSSGSSSDSSSSSDDSSDSEASGPPRAKRAR